MGIKQTIIIIFQFVFGLMSGQQIKEYKFGTPFKISVPSTYVKSYDLNDVALAQFTNAVNDKYVVVLQTEKDNLTFVQVSFSDIGEAGEYYAKSLSSGLVENGKLSVTEPKKIKIGNYEATEILIQGALMNEEETETNLFYHLTVVETQNNYYQIISWSNLKDRNKNLTEFINIAKTFVEL